MSAQPKPADLEVIQIRPQFYVIAGGGSNVAVQLGPDGHPSKNVPHTAAGFSGVWEGTMITAHTTHLKTGLVWRNGVPHSRRR